MINFFLRRHILSIGISLIISIFGITCLKFLPVEQFPNLSPPIVTISASFPGANADMIALAVAGPLENALMGTDEMTYMSSESTLGSMTLTAYFRMGHDANAALKDIQNRVNLVTSMLPEEVRKEGITVAKSSSNLLLMIAIQDVQELYDTIFLTNYASLHLVPELQRIPGVSLASVMNASDYSMRIWLQPDRMAQFQLAPSDVSGAIQEQNAFYSIGEVGQQPAPPLTKLTIPVSTSGLLKNVEEFEQIILRSNPDGSTILLKDISQVELGAQSYDTYAAINGKVGAFISIRKTSNANALEVASALQARMDELSQFFPAGISYSIPYNTTTYIKTSMEEIARTLVEAVLLVSLVICLFLQSLRAALIPILAMIVSILGTFFGMYLLGYSINTLSLFGLTLATGIVVDDAIVVVEGVELNMRTLGLSVKEAVLKTMHDVAAPIIAIVFALFSVFTPVAFMSGIAGQLYKQFTITIVISVVISGFVALTLSPVLAMVFLKKRVSPPPKWTIWFNRGFATLTDYYMRGVNGLMRHPVGAVGLYALFLTLIGVLFSATPLGFIPNEDQGVIIISAALPDGASLNRTQEVSLRIEEIVQAQPGVQDIVSIAGGEGNSNGAMYYLGLRPWSERKAPDLHSSHIVMQLNQQLARISEAKVVAFNLPPLPGIGASEFYDLWIVNHGSASPAVLNEVVQRILAAGQARPEFSYLDSTLAANSMGIALDVDTMKAKAFGVSLGDLFHTLQMLLGSMYINDFSHHGKMYKVIAQAEPKFRNSVDDIGNVCVPSTYSEKKEMIPLKSFVTAKFANTPAEVTHYNGAFATSISVGPAASPEKVIAAMEQIASKELLPGMSFAWSGTAYEAKKAALPVLFALIGGMVMLFLSLAALYNRWILPFTVFLAIPFGILGALIAVWMKGLSMDLYFQIGLIASIGISAKNAILIVEFARLKREEGMSVLAATREAARLRFRAIIMTSLTLILATAPLLVATGAGAASRHSVGTGILGGMVVATSLALFFVPFFFRWIEREEKDT